MSNKSIEECAAMADSVIQGGGTVYQKFTCVDCGARQTMSTPNVFYTSGNCEECGATTDLRAAGCGFSAMFNREKENENANESQSKS